MNNKKKNKYSLQYKLVAVAFTLILVYFANKDHSEISKSQSQIQYENWLIETEAKARAAMNNESLPALSLTVIPANEQQPAHENIINANNISDSKDKILRLLSLINEAGLYNYQKEKMTTKPGDIILKITAPNKTITFQFKPQNIESNIKASLMLKLFQEYTKDKIPENMANNTTLSNSTLSKSPELKDSIFAIFEAQDKNNN